MSLGLGRRAVGVLLTLCTVSWIAASALRRDDAAVASGKPAPLEPSALRCSDRSPIGTGLNGEYFATPGQQGRRLFTRVDPTLDFDARRGAVPDGAGARARSARWRGWIKAPLGGHYRFHVAPGARVTVGGLPMAGGAAAADASIDLSAGSFYPVVVEADLDAPEPLRLEWTPPHGARYVVPRAALFLPTPVS